MPLKYIHDPLALIARLKRKSKGTWNLVYNLKKRKPFCDYNILFQLF